MSSPASAPGLLNFLYGHVPVKGVPPMHFEERGNPRQFLIDEGAVEDSSMIVPNLGYVKYFAWYTAINTCSDNQIRRWDCRDCSNVPTSKFVTSFDNADSSGHGYIAIDRASKRIICSFRGSVDSRDEIRESRILRKPYVYANEKNVTVAARFLEIMESLDFVTPLKPILGNYTYSDYKIAFVGHSLGGALASLALPKVQSVYKLDWKRLELYTYGQPRTGNLNFARWYNKKTIASARVVNNTDPVPHDSDAALADYHHHMNELWIEGPPDSYKLNICSNDQLEDPECSYKATPSELKRDDHLVYFGVDLAREC
ncbi:hypothetical protein DSO57_1026206 [Entomophthora muscae]|uniref:Uncharacterized protein n=1 Tax=Entomophthora muscae TaxID=34485 RepID=A0ACC2T281_9FUNG|nr:hypothetical protein DSO57_1026206 [Entomophthora muscae]